jgi:hypothetical protein
LQPSFYSKKFLSKSENQKIKKELKNEVIVKKGFNSQKWKFKIKNNTNLKGTFINCRHTRKDGWMDGWTDGKQLGNNFLSCFQQKLSSGKRKNYGNSNISPCKNVIFKKSSGKKTKILSTYQHKPKYIIFRKKILI